MFCHIYPKIQWSFFSSNIHITCKSSMGNTQNSLKPDRKIATLLASYRHSSKHIKHFAIGPQTSDHFFSQSFVSISMILMNQRQWRHCMWRMQHVVCHSPRVINRSASSEVHSAMHCPNTKYTHSFCMFSYETFHYGMSIVNPVIFCLLWST